jgi:Flp pilus assembly protein TadD
VYCRENKISRKAAKPQRKSMNFLGSFAALRLCARSFLVLTLAGCGRQAARPAVERVAILRFENLSPDSSADWMGRAFSDILSAELTGAPGIDSIPANRFHNLDRSLGVRTISSPGISSERSLALAAGATEIGYGQYAFRAGKLEAQLTLEDVRTGKMTKVVSTSAAAGDVLGAASGLARQIAARTAPYGTRNPQALRAYITGTESRDPAATEVAFNLAITADPDFAEPYRVLAQLRAAQRDRAGALAILERAEARGNSIPELERARMAVLGAELRNDGAARQKALAGLVKLEPGDSAAWRALGEVADSRHDDPLAVRAFQKAAELEPQEVIVLNTLGYYAARAGDLEAGMAALRRYQALRPKEANPLDSMGDINLITGHLAEAENFYLMAQKQDRTLLNDVDLLKAATASLYRGDTAHADTLARQFREVRNAAKDPLTPYRQAEWLWSSGHRKEAYRQLETFAAGAQGGPLREFASRANAELTIWNLVLGDRTAAAGTAQQAMALAGPSSVGVAVLAQFLTQPPASPTEWVVRAEQRFSGEALAGIRDLALSYALLLNGHFQAAQLLLKQMYDGGTLAADEGLPYVLAWAYLETGHTKEAEPLIRANPAPGAAGAGPFAAFYLPRLFYLRGVAAAREGKREEARNQYQLFLKLSGNDPLVWGEEKKAQEAVR